jgi:hypothetical protein
VPVLPGVHFSVDGHVVVTTANGQASYTAQHDFAAHTLALLDTNVQGTDRRYEFNRWAGQRDPKQAFSRTVTALPLRTNSAITAAFTVQQKVLPRFVEQNGSPLDLTRVSAITVKSDAGQVTHLSPGAAAWLDGMRPVYHNSQLSAQPATYTLQSVIVSGTNVVDAGRQAFTTSLNSTPTFITQFHALVITGHDALFKSPAGKQAILTFPDGSRKTVNLDAQHSATVLDLPRGKYSVHVKAGAAIVAADQFVLARDMTANLVVISVWDLLALGATVLLVALVLLAIGRRRRWHVGRRWDLAGLRNSRTAPAPRETGMS